MNKLRAGVIGAGAFGRIHARKYAEDARASFVGVFDPDDERAQQLADTHGARAFPTLGAMMSAIDIVTIASPPSLHGAAVQCALDAGKHVLVEKPLATDAKLGAELVAHAAENKLVLACGHQERLVFDAMGLLSAPETPTFIESVREGPWTGRSADVSVTLDLMVHDLDLALTLLGPKPLRIGAEARAEMARTADWICARLEFSNAEAVFTASRVANHRKRSMRAVYPSGEVRIDFLTREFSNTTGFALNAAFAETRVGADPLGANVAAFIDAVLGLTPRPAVTGKEALGVLEVALDVDRVAGLPSLS